jgi:hypothetical protein
MCSGVRGDAGEDIPAVGTNQIHEDSDSLFCVFNHLWIVVQITQWRNYIA